MTARNVHVLVLGAGTVHLEEDLWRSWRGLPERVPQATCAVLDSPLGERAPVEWIV